MHSRRHRSNVWPFTRNTPPRRRPQTASEEHDPGSCLGVLFDSHIPSVGARVAFDPCATVAPAHQIRDASALAAGGAQRVSAEDD